MVQVQPVPAPSIRTIRPAQLSKEKQWLSRKGRAGYRTCLLALLSPICTPCVKRHLPSGIRSDCNTLCLPRASRTAGKHAVAAAAVDPLPLARHPHALLAAQLLHAGSPARRSSHCSLARSNAHHPVATHIQRKSRNLTLLGRDRCYMRPHMRRFSWMMMSLTAAMTKRICIVSVAHVKCV